MRRLLILLVLANGQGFASSLFEDDEILEFTLEGPLTTTIKDHVERDEFPFALIVDSVSQEVNVRVRGNSRVRVCNFPPLSLGFSASVPADSIFSGQRRLKLVTHCKKGADFEQNVLEEYAAYRILNVLSDVSFRTRLARIRYVDTDKPDAPELVRYAFLVESKSALADRHGGELVRTRRVVKNNLDQPQAALVYVFQYLIGNTDWSLVRPFDSDTCCHNGDLVDIQGSQYYAPYDFDMAGLVNARYAKPDPALRIKRVTQRRYRGYCIASDVLRSSIQTIVEHRSEILDVIEDLPDASPKDVGRRSKYLEHFFTLAADEEKLLKRFEGRCL